MWMHSTLVQGRVFRLSDMKSWLARGLPLKLPRGHLPLGVIWLGVIWPACMLQRA